MGTEYLWYYSQEEEYASVGHGISQSQNSTSHNGITQVEDGHTKGGFPFKLIQQTKKYIYRDI